MSQQLHVDQIANIAIRETDAAGNTVKAKFDANPVWTNSNAAAGTLVVDSNGTTAVLTPAASPGSVDQVTIVSVEALIGGTKFTASDDFTIVAGPVAGIVLDTTFAPKP